MIKVFPYQFDPKIWIEEPPTEKHLLLSTVNLKGRIEQREAVKYVKCQGGFFGRVLCDELKKAKRDKEEAIIFLTSYVSRMTEKQVTYLTRATGDDRYMKKWKAKFQPKLPSHNTMKLLRES